MGAITVAEADRFHSERNRMEAAAHLAFGISATCLKSRPLKS